MLPLVLLLVPLWSLVRRSKSRDDDDDDDDDDPPLLITPPSIPIPSSITDPSSSTNKNKSFGAIVPSWGGGGGGVDTMALIKLKPRTWMAPPNALTHPVDRMG